MDLSTRHGAPPLAVSRRSQGCDPAIWHVAFVSIAGWQAVGMRQTLALGSHGPLNFVLLPTPSARRMSNSSMEPVEGAHNTYARELQYRAGKQSVLSGLVALCAAMIYGTQVDGVAGHPVLALAVWVVIKSLDTIKWVQADLWTSLDRHVQLVQNGMLVLLGGLLLLTPRAIVCKNVTMLRVIQCMHGGLVFVMYASEIWGAKTGIYFPRTLARAGLPAAGGTAYNVFLVAHFGPALVLIVSWCYLAVAVYTTTPSAAMLKDRKVQ